MAGCQDLVDAVNRIADYLRVENPEEPGQYLTAAQLLLSINTALIFDREVEGEEEPETISVCQSLEETRAILEDRLTRRAFKHEVAEKTVEALKFIGENISERGLQQVQVLSNFTVPVESGLEEIIPVDSTTDDNPI